jgi:PAS domain S-box-containing protein
MLKSNHRAHPHQSTTKVVRLLTEPLRDLPTPQAHLARLGAFMWLTLALLLTVIGLLAEWQGIAAGNTFYVSMASLILAYALSRIGRPRLSAWLMIVITMINLGMAAAPHGALINPRPLYYLVMPIAAAAIFLNLTAVLGVLLCALLEVFVIYWSAQTSLAQFLSESPFFFLSVVTFAMMAVVLHRQQIFQMRCQLVEASEQRLRDLIDHMPVMVDVIDENGTIQLWNKECERVTGYSAVEIIGDPSAFERLYPDRAYREAMRRHYGMNSSYRNVVYRLTCKDGSRRAVAWSVVEHHVPEPAWRRLAVGVDVTEQHRRERELSAVAAIATALRAADSYAEMLPLILDKIAELMDAEAASLGVLEQTENGEQLVLSAAHGAWERKVGLKLDAQHGLYAHVVQTRRPYKTADAYHDPLVARPELLNGVSAVAAVPLIAQERAFGVIGVGRRQPFSEDDLRVLAAICDIAANALQRAETLQQLEARVQERTAQLAAAYKRLEAQDRLKTKLIGDLAHELRTPLSTLKIQARLIATDLTHPKVPERLQTMNAQIERLGKLVEGALDLLRLEMKHELVTMQPQAIDTLLRQVCDRARGQLTAQQRFEVQIAPNLPMVFGNGTLLARALENVLDNALKYTAQGTIALCAERHNAHIAITISDTGIGILPEDLPHVIERFYRGKTVGQSNIAGIGLGLTIAERIVALHGGALTLESAPQVGTQVRLTLPALN